MTRGKRRNWPTTKARWYCSASGPVGAVLVLRNCPLFRRSRKNIKRKVLSDTSPPEIVNANDLHRIGVLCQIQHLRGDAKSGYQVVVQALKRVIVDEVEGTTLLLGRARDLNSQIDMDAAT